MNNTDYDIERLRAGGEIDIDYALNNFNGQHEFIKDLLAFVANPQKNLMGFDAYKISHRSESRKEFLVELKILREKLTQLGLTEAAANINHLEYASFNKDEAFLERELSEFRFRMETLSKLVAAAYKPPVRQTAAKQALSDDTAAQAAENQTAENQAAAKEQTSIDAEKHIILAVDDMKALLSSVVAMLLDKYIVMAVTNGASALKILERHSPSLFLLDIEMPRMNGYELAAKIRAIDRFKNTPIIFLTAKATRDAVVTAVHHGGNDYIVKPVEKQLLLEKIEKFLG